MGLWLLATLVARIFLGVVLIIVLLVAGIALWLMSGSRGGGNPFQ